MSLRNRVPKHQNKGATLVEVGPIPHSSKCLSLESAGICCLPTDPTRRRTRKQNKVTGRERAVQAPIACPFQSQRWIPGGMPPWLYRVTATAPLHQTHGIHLPLWATVMVPQTPGPLRKRGEGRKRRRRMSGWGAVLPLTMPVSQRTQRMAHNGSSSALWWTTTKWVVLLYYKYHRKEPHNSDRSRLWSIVIFIHVKLNSRVIILEDFTDSLMNQRGNEKKRMVEGVIGGQCGDCAAWLHSGDGCSNRQELKCHQPSAEKRSADSLYKHWHFPPV